MVRFKKQRRVSIKKPLNISQYLKVFAEMIEFEFIKSVHLLVVTLHSRKEIYK